MNTVHGMNTASQKTISQPAATASSKFEKVCTASKKPPFSPTNSSASISPHTGTPQSPTPPVYGATTPVPRHSPWQWTTSELNFSAKQTPITFSTPSKPNTSSPKIGQVPPTSVSPLIGTTPQDMLTFPCLAMSPKP